MAATLVVAALVGCGHQIGDSCNQNSDCSALGDRFCDIAQFKGYCTIEGCDVRADSSGALIDSCNSTASESMCVRFFSPISAEACDPASADPKLACSASERCLCDCDDPANPGKCLVPNTLPDGSITCAAGGTPATQVAHCANEASERRWCVKTCKQDSDCRTNDGYACLSTGQRGAEPVARRLATYTSGASSYTVGVGDRVSFCVQVQSPKP